MLTLTSLNEFTAREGEAPAEPLRRKLGRSLALPLFSNADASKRCLQEWGNAPAEPVRHDFRIIHWSP